METIVLGSGGCQIIPRPCCQCKICKEARKKGRPYERLGPSFFIKDANILIDTPEEISIQLNRENINQVDHIFYTHWHPDHTAGKRLIEQLYLNWYFLKGDRIIKVYLPGKVYDDVMAINNKFGSDFEYFEKKRKLIKIIKLKDQESVKIKGIKVTPIMVDNIDQENVAIYLFEERGKKLIYAICDMISFPVKVKLLKNADILIIQTPFLEGKIKYGLVLDNKHILRRDFYSFEEIFSIASELKIKRIIFSHIEEIWHKSYDDFKKLAKKYQTKNVEFAFDGMKIKL